MSKLFLFTSQYPEKRGDGAFIKNEIEDLALNFDNIYIAKLHWDKSIDRYRLPENVEVVFEGFSSKKEIMIKGLFNLCSILPFFFLLKQDLFKIKKIKHIKMFIIAFFIGRGVIGTSTIKNILKNNSSDNMVLYFFWGTGMSYILPWIKKYKHKVVTKLHRGDIYVEVLGYIPFRRFILKRINTIITISDSGKNYINDYIEKLKLRKKKVLTIKLGTFDRGVCIEKQNLIGQKSIVSCSAVIEVKRVPLLFNLLNELSIFKKIKWTHFGTGSGMADLEDSINKNKNKNLDIELKGYVDNDELIDFYKNNPIDLFINVSSSEGIPVSIMEATSFNIPVLATDAGGTGELVGDTFKTGKLVPINFNIDDVVSEINSMLFFEYDNYTPRDFWMKNHNGSLNNKKLINALKGYD